MTQTTNTHTPANTADNNHSSLAETSKKPDGNSLLKQPWLGWLLALVFMVLFIGAGVVATWQLQAANAKHYISPIMQDAETPSKAETLANATQLNLRNVDYCWTPQTCARLEYVTAQLAPNKGTIIDINNTQQYHVSVDSGSVRMDPGDFAGMLNDRVFNYPDSALRNLKVTIAEHDNVRQLHISGQIRVLFWIPFDMKANLNIDKGRNALILTVNSLDVLGIIPAKWAIDIDPLNLDKLLPPPKNGHLTIEANTLYIKPFGLFPPPIIQGQFNTISVEPSTIQLTFSGKDTQNSMAQNQIRLTNGSVKFGTLTMNPTQITVKDQAPDSPFYFSLVTYPALLAKSDLSMDNNGHITVVMPDAPKPTVRSEVQEKSEQ